MSIKNCLFNLIMVLSVIWLGIVAALAMYHSENNTPTTSHYDNLPAPDHDVLENGYLSIRLNDPAAGIGWITDNTAIITSDGVPFFGGQTSIYFWDTDTQRYKFGISGSRLQANEATDQLFMYASIPVAGGIALNQAQMRDFTTGELLYELDFDLAFTGSKVYWNNDNTRIIGVGAPTAPIYVWDAPTGEMVATFRLDPPPGNTTSRSAFQNYLTLHSSLEQGEDGYQASGDNHIIHVIDITQAEFETQTWRFAQVKHYRIVENLLYVIDGTDTLLVYDLTTEEHVFSTQLTGLDYVYLPVLALDEHILFFTTADMLHALELGDETFVEPLFEIPFANEFASLQRRGINSYVYHYDEPVGTFTFHDLDSTSPTYGEIIGELTFEEPLPRNLARVAKYHLALVRHADSSLEIIDYTTGGVVFSLEQYKNFYGSPDDNYLAVEILPPELEEVDCATNATTIEVIDLNTFETVFEKTSPHCNLFGAWSPDSQQFAIMDGLGGFTIIPVASFVE